MIAQYKPTYRRELENDFLLVTTMYQFHSCFSLGWRELLFLHDFKVHSLRGKSFPQAMENCMIEI